MKTSQFLEKVSTLRLLFDPSWIDGCPGCPGPVFNEAVGDYIIAGLLRQISTKFKLQSIAKGLLTISRQMAESSPRGLVAGWEDGDDICPPWWPHHKIKGPQPDPWYNRFGETNIDTSAAELIQFSPAMEHIMIAGALKHLASLTTNANYSKEIFEIGQQIVEASSSVLFDEYCGTVPRPRPKPKYEEVNKEFNIRIAEMG